MWIPCLEPSAFRVGATECSMDGSDEIIMSHHRQIVLVGMRRACMLAVCSEGNAVRARSTREQARTNVDSSTYVMCYLRMAHER